MKKYIGILLPLVFVFTTCAGEDKALNRQVNDTSRYVVVIIYHAPDNPAFIDVAPGMHYGIEPAQFNVWDNYQKTTYKPRLNVMDTILLPVQRSTLLIECRYGYDHIAQTVAKPGDELHIYYRQRVPVFSITNRVDEPYNGSLHVLLDSIVYGGQEFTHSNMFMSYIFLTNALMRKGVSEKFKSQVEYGQLFLFDLQREQKVIDSLLQQNLLSVDVHAVHTDRILFQQHIIRLRLDQYSQAVAAHLIDSLRQVPEGKPYSYYAQFCEAYVDKFIENKLPQLKGVGSIIVDYRRAYDSVKLFAQPLHKGVQAQLLYQQLEHIAQYFSSADLTRYLADYVQTTGDTASANAMANAYLMDLEPLRQMADSVYLIGTTLQKTTLDQVLKANKGKVVFIDCWASWCLPCIEAMPYTKKLLDNYGDKGLTVLFLSFDRKKDDWQKANDKHGLRFLKNNFLVVNPAMSTYLKKLKVSSLPRYLLFNKKGQLVNAKAQDAKSSLTKEAIVKLLKE